MLKELENTVVNVQTIEEYDEYMQMCEDAGWVWHGGSKPTEEAFFNKRYKENTCIEIEDRFMYWSKEFAEFDGNTILTLQELKQKLGNMKYKQGDIVECKMGSRRKVLGICGEVYFMSLYNDYKSSGGTCTQYSLDDNGNSLYTEEKKTELSMDEVAEKFGVDVKNLKIKK